MGTYGGDDGDYVECDYCKALNGLHEYEDWAHEWALENGWTWDEKQDKYLCSICNESTK